MSMLESYKRGIGELSFLQGESATTPYELIEEIGSKLTPKFLQNPDRKYFIPYGKTGDFAVYLYDRLSRFHSHEHIMGNQIYIVETSKNMCILMRERFGFQNVIHGDILTPTSEIKNVMNMMFDAVLMNPPYKSTLHMEIFNRCFRQLKDGGHMVCVHPSTPFINRKPTRENAVTTEIKKIVTEYKTRLTLIDGNRLFNAGFFSPLSITHLKKVKGDGIEVVYSHFDAANKEVHTYKTLDDIFIHGNDTVLNIRDKVFSKMTKSFEDMNARVGATSKWYLGVNIIVGHPPKNGKLNSDFNCLIFKSDQHSFDKLVSKNRVKGQNQIGFSAKTEVENAFEFCKTKFARFCVSLYKINQTLHRGELRAVPYMDFSRSWTDEQLFDHFGLNKKERAFVNSYIGDWYEGDFKK